MAASLTADEILTHQGSLLTSDGIITASYDLEQQSNVTGEYTSIHSDRIFNSSINPFQVKYHTLSSVHIINGMGVTLGDSIIGLSAIEALRHINPALHPVLYRPSRAPSYVDSLYHLASGIVAEMRWLPWSIDNLPSSELCIDVGNHLFWPKFETMPMIDFFLSALGVEPAEVPADGKTNRWIKRLCLPPLPAQWLNKKYVLFCSTASTPIRSIPNIMHQPFVSCLWNQFRCPVLGFGAIDHPHYIDIQSLSIDTGSFLTFIKHARHVLTSDTAAVHAAAGFDIPTTAFFTSIPSTLRTKYYPLCKSINIELPKLKNMHASNRKQDIIIVEQAYRNIDISALLESAR